MTKDSAGQGASLAALDDKKAESPARDLERGGGLNEPILADDYPVYGDYMYVADGKVYRSDWHGITVRQLKMHEGFKEVRRCDIFGRIDQTPSPASPASEVRGKMRALSRLTQ